NSRTASTRASCSSSSTCSCDIILTSFAEAVLLGLVSCFTSDCQNVLVKTHGLTLDDMDGHGALYRGFYLLFHLHCFDGHYVLADADITTIGHMKCCNGTWQRCTNLRVDSAFFSF